MKLRDCDCLTAWGLATEDANIFCIDVVVVDQYDVVRTMCTCGACDRINREHWTKGIRREGP
jgi:hypothetical protein